MIIPVSARCTHEPMPGFALKEVTRVRLTEPEECENCGTRMHAGMVANQVIFNLRGEEMTAKFHLRTLCKHYYG